MSSKRLLFGIAALALVGIGVRVLLHQRCRVDERRALDELSHFGNETRAFAFDVNRRGYVSPATLVRPSVDQPSVRLLPARYLLEERGGYRFVFEGREGESDTAPTFLVTPAYQDFTYSAVPLSSSCATRSYLLSSETMAIHVRDDGALPTTEDPVAQTLHAASGTTR